MRRPIITAHKRSLGQGNIFAPVCHSVNRGEYLGRYNPQAGTLPWAGTLLSVHAGIRSTNGWYAFYWNAFLLPPANEVWGKVIFLHLFVILFTGGSAPGEGLLQGGACSRGSACSRGCLLQGGACSWGVPGGEPPGWLLLQTVHILLECILVLLHFYPNCMKMKRIGPRVVPGTPLDPPLRTSLLRPAREQDIFAVNWR